MYYSSRMEAVRFFEVARWSKTDFFFRPGKRVMTVWLNTCHGKSWASLCFFFSLYKDVKSRVDADDNQRLSLLPPHAVSNQPKISTLISVCWGFLQRELLAYKLHKIGRSFLTNVRDGIKTTGAIQWLQWAFSMVDQLEESAAPGIAGLKVC